MRPDWIIHYILCDRPSSHTHGLDKYGSLELELNLPVSDKKATEVLNLVGEAIAEKGRRYRSGDYEDGIFTLPFYLYPTGCCASWFVTRTGNIRGRPAATLTMPPSSTTAKSGRWRSCTGIATEQRQIDPAWNK